jgi:Tol biopolymer transport system component
MRRHRLIAGLFFVVVLLAGGAVAVAGNHTAPLRAHGRSSRLGEVRRRCPPGDLGTVAFIHGGALELLDLHGCRVRTLVRSGVKNPVQISPDGRWVAFGGGYVAVGGGPVHRTPGLRGWWPSGTWSPRGDVLAVVTARGGLVLERPGGRSGRLLPDGWGAQTVAFSPDRRTLAVSRSRFGPETIPHPSRWHQEIWLVDLATGAKRMAFRLHGNELAPPLLQGFSPDGHWLVFWEDSENSSSLLADGVPLLALPVTGGRPRLITSSELHEDDFLTWCGSSLIYVLDHGGRQVTLGDGLAAAAVPAWHSRTIIPAGGRTSWNALACSPRGRLAVAAGPTSEDLPFGHEHRSLWLVPLTGGTLQRLTQPPPAHSDELPQWSPDGRWLLFVRTRTHVGHLGYGELYALQPASGHLVGPIAPIGRSGSYYGDYDWENWLDWHR